MDGEGGMLPQTPWVMRENGDFKKIPTMLGHCQNDAFTSVVNCKYCIIICHILVSVLKKQVEAISMRNVI